VANKSTAFQAGFWRRFMPQNKFCGYENSAFQAQKVFNARTHRCLKGKNIHNRRSPTCGQRCNKHTLPERQNFCRVVQMNIHTGKNKPTGLKFLFLYFPFLYFFQLSIIH
jgi:hypothetical protein